MNDISRHNIFLCLLAFLYTGSLAGQVEPFTVAPADPVRNYDVPAITVAPIEIRLNELPEGCASGGNVGLPISIPQLTATRIDQASVRLNWKTFDDDRTNRWALQRRLGRADDFSNIKELTEINFLGGDHTDLNKYPDETYYRLYGISPEGEEVFSSIVTVGNARQLGRLLVFPNPSASVADVSLPSVATSARLTLVDGLGRVVWRAVHPEGGPTTLRLPSVKPGAYLLRWEVADGQVAVTRFVRTGI